MPFFILLLLLLLFVPWVGFLLVLFFLVFLFVFVPLGFAAHSLLWLVLGPGQLLKVLFNKRVRRNHALEHATVNVIEGHFGTTNVAGLAYDEGFSLKGMDDPYIVLAAAKEGLERLKNGERDLAIHPRCGTTIVVTNTLSAVTFIILLLVTGYLSWLTVLIAVLCAHIFGTVLSKLAQRYLTTDQDVSGMEITGVELRTMPVYRFGLRLLLPQEIFVRTRQPGEVLMAEVVSS